MRMTWAVALGSLAILLGATGSAFVQADAAGGSGRDDIRGQGASQGRGASPTFDGPPAGMTALPLDLFTTKNFYKDQALYSDQRYFRCNTPRQIIDIQTAGRMGANPPLTAKWGDCKQDVPREKLVSPYAYKSAKEHYEALLAKAKAHGGPTKYTKATVPDWDGAYLRDNRYPENNGWLNGMTMQVPTIMSLETPEYQRRTVMDQYHESVDNAQQWNASFCLPDGFMRWWVGGPEAGNFQLVMTPYMFQTNSGNPTNMMRQFMIGKTEHVLKVPQFMGETIAFWDGTSLIAWTSNIQGWTMTHGMFEFSDKLEAIETFKPALDAKGKFIGLDHEAVFYDSVAFVQPLWINSRYLRRITPDDPTFRYSPLFCLGNIQNREGRPKQLTQGDLGYKDHFNRPWARNWEEWFEKGWDRPPSSDDLPSDVLNLLN